MLTLAEHPDLYACECGIERLAGHHYRSDQKRGIFILLLKIGERFDHDSGFHHEAGDRVKRGAWYVIGSILARYPLQKQTLTIGFGHRCLRRRGFMWTGKG